MNNELPKNNFPLGAHTPLMRRAARHSAPAFLKVRSVVALLVVMCGLGGLNAPGATAYVMSGGDYSEGFANIATWTDNFASGTGAAPWSSVGVIGSGTSVTTGTRTTKSSAAFVTTTAGGIQKGTLNMVFLSTGSTATPEAVAVDLLLDFTGRTAGTLSFDWAAVDNSSGTRPTSLRFFWSTDNSTFTEITAAQVLDVQSVNSGSISAVALPSAFNGSSTARLRFYNHAGTITGSGSRDKISIDNVAVTSTAATPSIPTASAATGITSSNFTANWSSASGATGYRLDVATDSGVTAFGSGGFTNLDVGNVTTTNVSGLSASTTYYYRVRAYNGAGTSGNSSTITVTTTSGASAPSIAVQPVKQTNNYNTTATFAVTASGTAPLSYQWRTNGVALTDNSKFSGALTIALSVSNVLFADTITNLTVVITNATGSVTSSIVTLTVVDPFIVTQPANATNLLGGPAIFTVTASGSGTLNYQWRTNGVSVVNGGRFSGATTASLTNSGILAADTNWNYTVVVGGAGLSVTSAPAALGITNAPALYRSKTSGNWNDFATWQVDINTGGGFVDATTGQTPTSADGTIEIRSGHNVTNTTSVTVDQVTVASGGLIAMTSAFTVNNATGDDIVVQSGGVFVLPTASTPPSFNSGATAKIEGGGILRVAASGLTAAGTGVNAASFVYGDASILEFAIGTATFSSSGVTFFPNVDASTIPIFRVTAISGSPGAANPTVFNGVFEAATNVTWAGTAAKTFRNGIRGASNLFQLGTAGIFIINGATADLGGAGTLALTNGLQISAGSITTLSSDKTLAGPGALTNLGTLDLNSRTLTAATAPVFVGTNLTAINRNGGSPLAGKIVLSSGTLTYGGVLTATNSGATLTGGEVFDLFDATTFTGAFTATNLPALGAGLNWWTGSLTNNGTIKVNRSPVATNLTLGVSVGAANTLQIIGGKNSPTDADADVLAVAAVTPGANGTVSFTSTNVTYTSTNSAGSDSFTYTVSDGFGGTATGTVNVSTYSAEGFNRLLPVGSISNGIFNLSYLGIPGTNYALDWATNLTPPINWVGLVTNQAATNGYLLFSVTNSGDVNFFRTRYAP